MILSANGVEVKIESLGKDLKVSATAEFDRKSLAGQTSSSAVAPAGNKPKKVSCGIKIPFDDGDNLTKLLELAEALDLKANPVVYTVADRLCQAMKMRQVIFVGSVKAQEDDTLLAYNVSFTLQESNSAAEKKEEREKASAVPSTPKTDGEVSVGTVDHEKIVKAAKI